MSSAIGKKPYISYRKIFEASFALILLVVCGPLIGVLAVCMGVYPTRRLGKNANPFTMYKLKTMKDGTEDDIQRITPIGKWCRKFSIDELPQLFNILKGEMSFIGPRPLPIAYNGLIKGMYRKRFEVLPGLTGLAQIKGRNKLSWREKFEYDVSYVSNKSCWIDLYILVATVKIVLTGTGVNSSKGQVMEKFQGFDEN